MKKVILIFSTLFLFTGMSNTLHAQTQEETEAWIKEKLELYAKMPADEGSASDPFGHVEYSDFEILKVSPCYFVFSYMQNGIFLDNTYEIKLPVQNLEISKDKVGGYYHKMVLKNKNKTLAAIRVTDYEDGHEIEHATNDTHMYFDANGEPGLYDRMNNAIDHLATFCKEAF